MFIIRFLNHPRIIFNNENFTTIASASIVPDVRGYHVYRDMWDASLGETLECEGANE